MKILFYRTLRFLSLGSLLLFVSGCATLLDIAVLTHNQSVDLSEVPEGHYVLDPEHSSLHFQIDHMGFSNFVGRFNIIKADFDFKKNQPESAKLTVEIDISSIDTNVKILDQRLMRSSFFDQKNYPVMTFEASGIQVIDERNGRLEGFLTLKGKTRPINMDVTFFGSGKNPLTRKIVLGFSAKGVFKRSDFGVSGLLPIIGDEVIFRIETEFYLDN